MEFLVHMVVGRIDAGDEREKQLRQEEAARSSELARQGILVRLWRVPGRRGARFCDFVGFCEAARA